ncbi:MAG: cytochrome P450 [Myxococcota bacterium]|jgi:cytochrome P450
MTTITVSRYDDAFATLRVRDLAQALYDEGAVIMEGVLLTLHGKAHRDRRRLENRVFRREIFRYYEREVIPRTIERSIAPFVARGHADLVALGYRVTMNLTADFAGIDRPNQTSEETEALLALVVKFSEGATLVHSTRDHEQVRAEVRDALGEFDRIFLQPSIARRRELLARMERGDIDETELPKDVLTVLLRNEERLPLPEDLLRREIAFYLQAGSHSTANSVTHAMHEIFEWCDSHTEDVARLEAEPLFLQRCIHESMRLHPASPVAWRKPVCPVELPSGQSVGDGDKVVVDMCAANTDPAVFGDDAAEFNPHRSLAHGVQPFGLTFGGGIHACPGQDLDGGAVPKSESRDAPAASLEEHLFGTVFLLVESLRGRGARRDPARPPERDARTRRSNWGRYFVIFGDAGEPVGT